MDVFDAVRTILAVRRYKDRPVPETVVRRIVEAGRLTASAKKMHSPGTSSLFRAGRCCVSSEPWYPWGLTSRERLLQSSLPSTGRRLQSPTPAARSRTCWLGQFVNALSTA
jgi:hypothetical protein